MYLETREVDYGYVDMRHVNTDDFQIIQRWRGKGFIQFGRMASEYLTPTRSHWVKLSDDAWRLVHEERKARAKRVWGDRNWLTTDEKRQEATDDGEGS